MLGDVYLKLHPNHSAIFHVNFGLVLSFLKSLFWKEISRSGIMFKSAVKSELCFKCGICVKEDYMMLYDVYQLLLFTPFYF